MTRPVWFDKGNDAQAVAEHLKQLSETSTQLRFTPVALPAGTDLTVLHQAALLRVRGQLSASHAEADRILSQEVRAIDDLVRSANLLVERLREWYALHAPEATRIVTDSETLAKLVAEKGDRADVMATLDQVKASESSLGSELDPADMAVLRGFAAALAAVHDSWHALEARVEESMKTVAPNVASVVGPIIGARMIALSGGLNRLATWPAGTVQLLGAETALFRHIKEGTKPPKHGILFQHPKVHLAPVWQRGAIARVFALAASKAAKADAFTKNDLTAFLADEVKTGLDRILRDKARPPTRKPGWAPKSGGQFRGPRSAPPSRGPPRSSGGYGPPARAPAPGSFRSDGPRDAPAPRSGFDRRGDDRAPARGFEGRNDGMAPGRSFSQRSDDRAAPRDDGARAGQFGRARSESPRRDEDTRPWKPKKKSAGAFRGDGTPAKPPSRGDK